MSKKPVIVACIPAYNEERTIAPVIIKTMKHVDKVIVCDDGSKDMTGEIARRLGAEVVYHEKNEGYGASLRSLFNRVRELDADVIVTLDADMQHDPNAVPSLTKPILSGEADIVIGSRFLSKTSENNIPRYRRQGIKIITNATKAVSFENITDAQSGYRAYNHKALNIIDPVEDGMGASIEILMKAKENGLNVVERSVIIMYDEDSNTHNPVLHGFGVILSIVKHYSIRKPLLFYGVPGTLAFTIAMIFWIRCLQIFSVSGSLSTNVALVAIFMSIIGLVLLTTAIIIWVTITALKEIKGKPDWHN